MGSPRPGLAGAGAPAPARPPRAGHGLAGSVSACASGKLKVPPELQGRRYTGKQGHVLEVPGGAARLGHKCLDAGKLFLGFVLVGLEKEIRVAIPVPPQPPGCRDASTRDGVSRTLTLRP